MNSSLSNEWIKDMREVADEKNHEKIKKETTKKNMLDLISQKFDYVPEDVKERVTAIDDLGVLDTLVKDIIKVDSIEEFEKLL